MKDRALIDARTVPSRWWRGVGVGVILLALAAGACAPAAQGYELDDSLIPGGLFLTRDELLRTNPRNALEALERARTHLMIRGGSGGGLPTITHRGIDSVSNDGNVLVVLDGQPTTNGVMALRDLHPDHIAYMKVFSSREATPRYGVLAGNGVVFVRTLAYEPPPVTHD